MAESQHAPTNASVQCHVLQAKEFGLDPVFTTHARLFIRDVVNLEGYAGQPGVFAILNHPILTVHIMGDVVGVDHRRHFTAYTVDDGTGAIVCVRWYNSDPVPNVALGTLVTVYGKVVVYRGMLQLRVYNIFAEEDPNAEVFHMASATHLRMSVYSKPFQPPANVLRYLETAQQGGSSGKSVEEKVAEMVERWLQTRCPDHFTLSTLYEDTNLIGQIQSECSGRGQSVSALLNRSLMKLLREDTVTIASAPDGDATFQYLSYERDLKPAVLQCITSLTQATKHVNGSYNVNGVHCDELVRSLLQFPRRRVMDALAQLQQSSDIYEAERNCYKTVVS